MNGPQTIARSNLRVKPLAACLLLPLAIGNLPCASVLAAPLPVTNCYDAGVGSLRAAIAAAQSGDTIDLSAHSGNPDDLSAPTCSRISLMTSELTIAQDDLTLQGPGADKLIIDGSVLLGEPAVIHHTGAGTLHVKALEVFAYDWATGPACILSSGNVALDNAALPLCLGAGVDAKSLAMRNSLISYSFGGPGVHTTGGAVSIVGSTISHNFGGTCSGLEIGGGDQPVLISNSTISGNQSAGCISQPTTIVNSTIAFNGDSFHGIGGELSIASSQIAIESSIFANNTGADLLVTGAASIAGHNNLVMMTGAGTSALPADTLRSDPLLLPLANNGGPTPTHALVAGSPAIDAGSNGTGLTTDQRGNGYARVAGSRSDIGAFELQPVASTSVSIGPGFTGSWFDPAQSGHGLMLEVLSDHRVLAMWFAFNPEGNQQAWFGGVGTYSGNTATITDVALPTGGRWIPNFDPNLIVRNPWGTLTFTFSDCNHGRVDFNSLRGYGAGSMNLLRLTQPAGLTCP